MHNNFYFLRQLSKKLNDTLAGFTIVSCFTQNKEELVLEFNNSKKSVFIRASLQSGFCCLSFPEKFNRARKNSVDLFPTIILKKFAGVRQFENERSFSIVLDPAMNLLFKMHGNRANVVLFENQIPIEIFRNHLTTDLDLRLNSMDRAVDFSKNYFETNQDKLRQLYFTFGKEVWSYLDEQGFENADLTNRWALMSSTLKKLEKPDFLIVRKKEKLVFSLLPTGVIICQFSEPLEAVTRFYSEYQKSSGFAVAKSKALKQLESRLIACQSFLEKNRQRLKELELDTHYQQWGDLVMANLGQIRTGMETVTVEDLYNSGAPVEIKLKKELNAQSNAEVYYRKAKNRQIEIQKLNESIQAKEKEIAGIQRQHADVLNEMNLATLDKTLEEVTTHQKQKETKKSLPYHEFEYLGFKIWVGKDAKSNDTLTLKYSFKDDLWLHAKDVAGSHVLIKYQAGKQFPKNVIERGAELAAYNSKRKTDSLCPVTVTPKKYVRKRKGDPAGMVVVEREDVILVSPKL